MCDKKEYDKKYRVIHKERITIRRKQYYRDHREEIITRTNDYYVKHREEINERRRQIRYDHGKLPMSENRLCTQFLGVHIAERMLSYLFKDVILMPYGNPGYDFICNNGHKIDVKSSCYRQDKRPGRSKSWTFMIKNNTTTDYFLCIAFDSREDLNPLHLWLIPGNVLSHLTGTTISESTLERWSEYELSIDNVIYCCDTLRNKNDE